MIMQHVLIVIRARYQGIRADGLLSKTKMLRDPSKALLTSKYS